MADKLTLIDLTKAIDERSSSFDMVRKVLLASVGAAVVAQEEIEAFVNRLVERGEIAEADARQLIADVNDRSRQQLADRKEEQERRLDQVLKRVNIPTRTDFSAISDRISQLSEQVDELLDAAEDDSRQP